MRFALLDHIRPEIARLIRGKTDTEWIYALCSRSSRTRTPRSARTGSCGAVERRCRSSARCGGSTASTPPRPTNLFISDGVNVVAVRFAFDYGCYDLDDPAALDDANHMFLGLWYTTGRSYGLHDGEWKMIGAPGAREARSSSRPNR